MLQGGGRPRVAVIGAGVAGLPIAVMLTEHRYKPQVTLIADKFSPNITSDAAGGIMRLNDRKASASDPRTDKWFAETYQYFTKLFVSCMAGKLGLSLVSSYTIFDGIKEDPLMKDIVLGFRHVGAAEKKVLNIPQDKNAWSYSTFTMPCTPFLGWQMEQFKNNGGTVVKRKLNSLQEVEGDYNVVVNCTGLGSKELVKDHKMYAVRGQVAVLRAPWVKHLVTAEVGGTFTYIIPRGEDVIVGGTTQVDNWSTDINPSDRTDIVTRCSQYIPSLAQAEVIDEWAGLRPGRKQVRLTAETLSTATMIVHNYDHAGKGLAFSIGCAKDTLSLIELCLTEMNFKELQ